MSKPALSSRLMGLKFMQRAQEKEKKAEAQEAAEQRDAEVGAGLVRGVAGWAVCLGALDA